MIRFLLIALFACQSVLAQGGLSPSQIREIETLISAEMSKQRIPGMSIAIATRDGSVWSNGYGISDLENFVPAKASTVYRTASIAKPITAVAALQLAQAGLLDLDAPIDRYIPEFPKKPWPVTMRQLLGHLGGIRHYKDDLEWYVTKHYFNLADAVKMFSADPLVSEPGTQYFYSTFGFVLAGLVVEVVARQPFVAYLQAHVFASAGMRDTGVDDVYALIPNRSRGYQMTSTGVVLNAPFSDTSHKIPGGGLVSTTSDLVMFALAIGNGKLLKKETVEEMFQPMKTKDGRSTGYGMGWGVGEFAGRRLVSHAGGQSGVSSVLRYLPSEGVVLAMMFNLQGVKSDALADQILAIAVR